MLAHHRSASTARGRLDAEAWPWHARLPVAWREMAVVPIAFRVHRDAELAAARCFGHDADDEPCYYAHRYRIDEPRSDDGEEFYAGVLHAESVAAWRLRDGRWLIHRVVRTDEHGEGQAFYSFSETMPR
ncbi:hypothetical protein dqs_3991 [Azoarcus olearius]|uniref:hypothetical protein n=1 Tax=Azoarcus sp. (strain BH72) TaxID=418699 RepID=UPI0008063C8F|nr:hypothetical protein [Azoarcus olearius]ANQ87007.1 hypothetical protein dqs_3991 [Azoarcus olearius]